MPNRSLLLLALLALGGCYSYSLAPSGAAPEGSRVRARISADEAARLREILPGDERVVEGRVLSAADGLLLEVPTAVTTAGASVQWLNQRVRLSPSDVLELEIRRLDPWRTAGIAAVLVTAIGYAAVEAFEAMGDPSSEGDKGEPVERSIGVSLPFPR